MATLENAIALFTRGQYPAALELAAKELPYLLNLAGAAASALGRHEEAEKYLGLALSLRPGFSDALNNVGLLLTETGRLEEAEQAMRQALASQPKNAMILNNLGVLLGRLGRLAECETPFRQALALSPDYIEALNNLGVHLASMGRYAEAEVCFRKSLAVQPGNADARYNLALLLLTLGCYEEAWPLYEARYHPEKSRRVVVPPRLGFPQWQGEPLTGKTLLVWHEQGFGDEIQFSRFIPLLKARGAARVGLLCKPALAPLLKTVDGLDDIYLAVASQNFPGYDYWTLPMSLPLHCGPSLESIPAKLPYLQSLPERVERWQARLPQARLRVGLVWKGSGEHQNDAHRSLAGLADLAPLWAVSGIAFVSLQKGAGEDEARQPPPGQPLIHLGSELEDFADSAAIVSQLDLVICVDTAIAHVAGALGKPCWVMLPAYRTDWRWLQGREDSPWYPNVVRLFRQTGTESWGDVVQRVSQALGKL